MEKTSEWKRLATLSLVKLQIEVLINSADLKREVCRLQLTNGQSLEAQPAHIEVMASDVSVRFQPL